MIVGMWRGLSKTEPRTERTNSVAVEPGIFTFPPYAMTVGAGDPRGKICAVDCATVTVYSLRMTAPVELVTTVGAYVRGIASWFTNWGTVVASSSTWFTDGVPTAWAVSLTSSDEKQPTSGNHVMAIPARRILVRVTSEFNNIHFSYAWR